MGLELCLVQHLDERDSEEETGLRWHWMIHYKVFLPPRFIRPSGEENDILTWQTVSSDEKYDDTVAELEPERQQQSQSTDDAIEEQEVENLYANTIFGTSSSVHESVNWDISTTSLPGKADF